MLIFPLRRAHDGRGREHHDADGDGVRQPRRHQEGAQDGKGKEQQQNQIDRRTWFLQFFMLYFLRIAE